MKPISPATGAIEIVLAKDQPEYDPLPVVVHYDPQYSNSISLLTRWTFTDVERAAIAAGEDLYLRVLTFGQPMQPLNLQVGPAGYLIQGAGEQAST